MDVEDESAKQRCTDVIIRIERELGPDHFVCELVIKVLTELLRKICMEDSAAELINEHMERKKTEDVGSLLLLSRIYCLFGDYRKCSDPLKTARKLAELSGEPLLISLVLVKEACSDWHLKNPEEARNKVKLSENILEDSDADEKYNTLPFTDLTHRLMDVYKTLGYIYRLIGEESKSIQYYLKALDILKKDKKSVTQIIKLETGISRRYARVNIELAYLHSMNVYETSMHISSNETYMSHHSLPIIHSLQRVAFILDVAGKKTKALEIYEHIYQLGEKYLGENHPEVARLAADTALLCNNMKELAKEELYVNRASTALECGSIDLSHIKLHVREISDAWKLLGKLFANKKDFEQTEKCYREAISINTRVYGCSHRRLAELYYSLAFLYKSNSKFTDALDCFKKSLEINRNFNPEDSRIILRIKEQIEKVKALMRKQSSFQYRRQ